MAYGIILVPEDPQVIRKIVDLSARVAGVTTPLMSLTRDLIPHLTLAHFEASAAAAMKAFGHFKSAIGDVVAAELTGLMFMPIPPGGYHVPEGGFYLGIEALRLSDLAHAHAEAHQAVGREGSLVLTSQGDRFRPHITVAILKRPLTVLPDIPPDLLRAAIQCRPVLGRIASYGTFSEIVAR